MGVTFNTHFCGGDKVSGTLYMTAQKCDHDDTEEKACCAFKAHFSMVKKHNKDCCKDYSKYVVVKKENIQSDKTPNLPIWTISYIEIYNWNESAVTGRYSVDNINASKYLCPRTRDPVSELCVQLC
ncbi:MAG: hypothetical protein KBF75_01200 [Saprospiraceae bacterium]|jgi:hypothetical protein|nr:hypothetical protein [Saprospiraceae bacterium]